MPDNPFQKVEPGQRLAGLPAAAWNGFLDAHRWYRDQQSRGGSGPQFDGGRGIEVPVKNISGADRSQFEVLMLQGIEYTAAQNLPGFKAAPILKATTPTTGSQEKFVILQEPIASNKIGRGLILGATPVQIDVVHAADQYADLIASDCTKLRSQSFGNCWIAYAETGTGTKWGWVVLGTHSSQILLGKTNANLSKNATGTINIYRGETKGSENFLSSHTVLAFNRFAAVTSGKWVLCIWLNGLWELIAAEC